MEWTPLGIVIRDICLDLWTMSCVHVVTRDTQHEEGRTRSDSTGGSTDLMPQCLLRLPHRGATLSHWRSVICLRCRWL